MTLSFAENLALLDLHGRAAVASLGQLNPDAELPPRADTVRDVAREHWATLEVWAWSLENPDGHWSERDAPAAPPAHADVVAGIETLVRRLSTSLVAVGPDTDIDYFGRPGNTADVARLVAYEAITVAHRTSQGSPGPTPTVSPAAARDGVEHVITHWSTSQPGIAWQPQTSAIRATDTGGEWHISLPQDTEDRIGDFRIASAQTPAATVQGPAVDVLWWLQGYPIPQDVVSVSGNEADVRALKQTFLQPVPKPPRRWFGLRTG